MGQITLGVARAISSSPASSRTASSAPPASRIAASCFVALSAASTARRRRREAPRAAHPRANLLVEGAFTLVDGLVSGRRAARLARAPLALRSALLELSRSSSSRSTSPASADARSTSAACAARPRLPGAQLRHVLTGVAKLTLGFGEAILGRRCCILERDRRIRLRTAWLRAPPRSSSVRGRSRAMTSALRVSRSTSSVGGAELCLVADNGDLQRDAARRGAPRWRWSSRRWSAGAARPRASSLERRAIDGDALAQLLDLAPRRKNASGLDLRAAGDQVRTAHDLAFGRGHRRHV